MGWALVLMRWLGGEWVWMGQERGWLGFCGGYELPYTLLCRVGAGFDFLGLGYRSAGRLGLWVWECFAFKEGLFVAVVLFSHLFKLLRSDHEFIPHAGHHGFQGVCWGGHGEGGWEELLGGVFRVGYPFWGDGGCCHKLVEGCWVCWGGRDVVVD